MPPRNPRRSCPVCAGEERHLLFRQRFAEIAGGSLLNGYDVVVCSDCGCGFADDLPTQDEFNSYYKGLSRYESPERAGENPVFERDRAAAIAGLIAGSLPSRDARVLEVGCATGRLLHEIRGRGFANVSGLDPSPSCAKTASREFGIAVETGTLFDLSRREGEADMVILVGVLEHIRDLSGALSVLRKVLKAEGRLYLEVPDTCEFATWLDAPFQQFSVEHINFFSRRSLENLLAVNGFRVLNLDCLARAVTETSTMPVIAAIFEKTGGPAARWVRDENTETRLLEYIRRSKVLGQSDVAVIDGLVESGDPIVIWGVGTNATRLLSTTRLGEANILAFFDSNPKVHGKEVLGVTIRPPAELREMPYPVLIASRVFQDEIERQIREDLLCPNRIIRLYPDEREADARTSR
jgi:SAM-dependent methyltransferase